MGRIKTALIKRVTFQILEEHKEKFTSDYAHNKRIVDSILETGSKKLRNIIAGYITRNVKGKKLE